MTFNQVKYILEVAKTGSINKAAENLFISQSALSTSIKRFESEIGRTVFYRNANGVTLTSFGKSLISYIDPIQLQIEQLETLVANPGKIKVDNLSIASNGYAFIDTLLGNLYYKYLEKGLHVQLLESHGADIMNLVANGSCEIGYLRIWSCYRKVNINQINAMGLRYYPLTDQFLVATIGPQHPLFKRENQFVTAKELNEYPSVMYEPFDAGPYSDVFSKVGITVRNDLKYVTNSRATLYSMIHNSSCFYLNSSMASPEYEPTVGKAIPNTRSLFIADCPVSSEMGYIKRSDKELSPVAFEFNEMVNEYVREHRGPRQMRTEWSS